MIQKNKTGQGIYLFAKDTATGAGKTGDSANITVSISKDGGANATSTNSVSEIGNGIYTLSLEQAETNCDRIAISAVSSTSAVVIDPTHGFTDQGNKATIDNTNSKVQGATIEVVSPVKSNNGETDIELQYGQEYDDDGNAPTLYGDVTWSIPAATEDLTNATGGNLYIYGPDSSPVATITDITYPNAGTSSQQAKAALTAANTQLDTETQYTYELWATFASGDPAKIAFGSANTLSKVPGN